MEMSKHPFRKALGLTTLYSIIIIGIFVLQFRNESVILRNIGLLRMSVAQTQESDGTMSLKNNVSVSFKGISFAADDVHPALLTVSDSTTPKPLILLSWEQPGPQSFKFNFTHDTSLTFSVNDASSKASLSISASLPDNGKSLSLFYKPVSGFSVSEQTKTRQLLSSKNTSYTMSAAEIKDNIIMFTRASNLASYTRFDPSKTFTFAAIPSDSETATAAAYDATIKKYRASVISLTTTAMADASTISESAVAAYIAEMTSLGKYTEAVESVPDSFKKGQRRSYFTAPFFNSLKAMNSSLVMANDNMASMVKNAVSSRSLDIFAVTNISDYILRAPDSTVITKLLNIPAETENFTPTLSQATGILRTYTKLAEKGSSYAGILAPVAEECVKSIAASCTISSDNLTLKIEDRIADFRQSVETGVVLLEYGKLTARQDYCNGGYMIVNTAFALNQNSDLRTIAELYPVLVPSNTAFPRALLVKNGSSPVWAWTCASNILYSESEDNTATITVSFKPGDTHYVILNGIKPFTGIEIYGLSFHTDSRFESYNSSGYVYDEATHTLFLKSRHKVTNEKIKLYFGKSASSKPVEKKTEAVQSAPQTATTAAETKPSSSSEYTAIPETTEE